MAEPLLLSGKKDLSQKKRQTYFTFGQKIKPGKFQRQMVKFSDYKQWKKGVETQFA